MEKRVFLYHFTDILFSEIVKETILIENWEEKDFDHRYVEYADVFLKARDKCLAEGFTEEQALIYFAERKAHIVKLFNERMTNNFRREFKKRDFKGEIADQLIPENIFAEDTINTNALRIFRDLEEKVFTRKQGEV